jgi:2-oxoglutarate ferredoxin oxidoreductase subunit delta
MGQSMRKELVFIKDKCKGCAICTIFCPKKIIELSSETNEKGFHYVIFNGNKKEACTKCLNCALVCPDWAIEVWQEEDSDQIPGGDRISGGASHNE